jgi:hypothetical protein
VVDDVKVFAQSQVIKIPIEDKAILAAVSFLVTT